MLDLVQLFSWGGFIYFSFLHLSFAAKILGKSITGLLGAPQDAPEYTLSEVHAWGAQDILGHEERSW